MSQAKTARRSVLSQQSVITSLDASYTSKPSGLTNFRAKQDRKREQGRRIAELSRQKKASGAIFKKPVSKTTKGNDHSTITSIIDLWINY